MDNDKTDYKKYKYIKVSGDIYSSYRLDNFNYANEKNKKINVVDNSNKKDNISNIDTRLLKQKIELSGDNISNNIDDNINIYSSTSSINLSEINKNGKSNSNANLSIKNAKNNDFIIKKSKKKNNKSYYKFINDIDINKILQDDNIAYEEQPNDKDININASNDIKISNKQIEDDRTKFNDKPLKDNKKDNINKRINKNGYVSGLIIVFIFVVTFFLCNYLLPNSLDKEVNEYMLYAVSKVALNKNDAESISNKFKLKGAGSYIYECDNKYYVVADIFETEEKAQSIINNPNNYNTFDYINKLHIKKYCFKYVEANLVENVRAILNYIDICYFDLKKIALLYGQKDIDKVEAKERVVKLHKQLVRDKDFFDNNTKSASSKNVIKLKAQLNIAVDLLDNLCRANNFASEIRDVYIKIIMLHIDLINDSYIK